jgi:hypothetical protein
MRSRRHRGYRSSAEPIETLPTVRPGPGPGGSRSVPPLAGPARPPFTKAALFGEPSAEIVDTGRRSLCRRRPVWRIRVCHGPMVIGLGYSPGAIMGWRFVGTREQADAEGLRRVREYLAEDAQAEAARHEVRLPGSPE